MIRHCGLLFIGHPVFRMVALFLLCAKVHSYAPSSQDHLIHIFHLWTLHICNSSLSARRNDTKRHRSVILEKAAV